MKNQTDIINELEQRPLVITYYSNASLSCFVPFEIFGGVYH